MTARGSALRDHWELARALPGSAPTSWRTAASTVRCQPSGGWSFPFDHGTTHGFCQATEARSPSTSTPSIGPGSCSEAQASAPALPPLPPDVETSTSVLRRSRPISCGLPGSRASCSSDGARVRKMRASSSSAAVPERSASPGE